MFLRSVLLGATALSASVSAMLVIPEMESQVEPVEDGFMNVHPMLIQETQHALIDLPCTECPFRQMADNGELSWTDGHSSSLILDFSIEDNTLLANGRQIFPPVPPSPIIAAQERDDGELSAPVTIGYALEVMPVASTSDKEAFELLDVRFTVLDLEMLPVPLDTVAIALIVGPDGNLYIARTETERTTTESKQLSWKQCNGKPKCLQALLVSRVRGLLAAARERVMGLAATSKMSNPKDCAKAKHMKGKHRGHHKGDKVGRPHRHHMHRPHPGAFSRTFSRVVHFIVIPAILGVLAGLTASAVGMLVGQVVVFVWQRFRGTQPQEHKAAWEQGDACEKQGLMTESAEDELPEYTEDEARGSMDKN
ncbi:hypothetical protein N7474_001901 [Penicillium riverlandense]|uniref:uncharacterized protein n=1 Tax=Penicillium riverlandense TaxID=1903569 RepID=UPI002549ADD8|nr:uncharacterized protein N7474_001901 [Penicillium riverlandense]KAJ5833590.1 hypothetical protein N7474_001901 [Penicillium riverlandense]